MNNYYVIRAGLDAGNMDNWSELRMTPAEAEAMRNADFIVIGFGID